MPIQPLLIISPVVAITQTALAAVDLPLHLAILR